MRVSSPIRVLERLSPSGLTGRALALAAAAAAAPCVLWLWRGLEMRHPLVSAAAAGASLIALWGLRRLLAPLADLAVVLDQAAGHDGEPSARRFQAGAMLRAGVHLARIARGTAGEPEPGGEIPSDRAAFVDRLQARFDAGVGRGVLGVIRFTDHDRLAAFDPVAADRAGRAFAQRLARSLAAGRPAARIRGDAFAAWFEGASLEEATSELRALGYVLAQEMPLGESRIAPQVALAAAARPEHADRPVELINLALSALPPAGSAGPDRLAVATRELAASARERFTLDQDLRQAVSHDQFVLHFQPVVDVESGRLAGAEALLRWLHPELGLVQPGKFIPLLESSELMEEAGVWVLNAACREARALRIGGFEGFKMAVNVSPRQLRNGALPALVGRMIERYELGPDSLEIELTETAALEDESKTGDLLAELRRLGVSVAIDDFGTGYSSLVKLKNLPFSKLKIDREFVAGVHARADNQAICTALIQLARGLGMAVLAEGAEAQEEVACLERMGCSLFQGYHFGRPMPIDVFVATVSEPAWQARLLGRGREGVEKRPRGLAAA